MEDRLPWHPECPRGRDLPITDVLLGFRVQQLLGRASTCVAIEQIVLQGFYEFLVASLPGDGRIQRNQSLFEHRVR